MKLSFIQNFGTKYRRGQKKDKNGISSLRTAYAYSHGLINYLDTKTKCRHLKKFTCKGTLQQVFICLGPPPLPGFCLGWSSNFVRSESGQIQSVKLFQNMVSNRTQHPPPSPGHTLSMINCTLTQGRGGDLNQREGLRGNSSQS
jgi:hypothetical protein